MTLLLSGLHVVHLKTPGGLGVRKSDAADRLVVWLVWPPAGLGVCPPLYRAVQRSNARGGSTSVMSRPQDLLFSHMGKVDKERMIEDESPSVRLSPNLRPGIQPLSTRPDCYLTGPLCPKTWRILNIQPFMEVLSLPVSAEVKGSPCGPSRLLLRNNGSRLWTCIRAGPFFALAKMPELDQLWRVVAVLCPWTRRWMGLRDGWSEGGSALFPCDFARMHG